MRLSTRLILAFAVVALLPAGLLGWITLLRVQRSFAEIFDRRLAEAERVVVSALDQARSEIVQATETLAGKSAPLRQLRDRLAAGTPPDPASLRPLASQLRVGLDADILELLDASGRILSSAHLPASVGDSEPAWAALARSAPRTVLLRQMRVRVGDGIDTRWAWVCARPLLEPGGRTVAVLVVGRSLDADWARRLAELSGTAVTLRGPDDQVYASGRPPSAPEATPDPSSLLQRRIDLGEGAHLLLGVSTAPLADTRRRILMSVGGAATLGVLAALLLGVLIARRITDPVAALAAAADRVAQGAVGTEVDLAGPAEIGRLIHAFNRMSRELKESQRRIAAAERVAAWQEIARRLAHEIKNPLTPIATAIETLSRARARRHPAFDEIFEESTTAILEEVEALKRLVTEFSSFARLPAPSLLPTPVEELIEQARALFPEAPAGIRIETAVAEGLPAVLADRAQMQQVLLNLVTNAIQALEASQRGGCIRLSAEQSGTWVQLCVEDDGPGIEASQLAEVFTPYFTTKAEGTGLGLAISHRIVTEHGGRIEVESRPGRTRFVVFLRRAAAGEEAEPPLGGSAD
ncbi:MAG: HAMP domain-containing protein [Deltaproteobacteria bacterium]|nr:MAG: HAMP domain-containing protein [Deltaproteobacteria bacterium]